MSTLKRHFPDAEGNMWPQRPNAAPDDFDGDAEWVKHDDAQQQIEDLEKKNSDLLLHIDNLRKCFSMQHKGYVSIDESLFIEKVMEDDAKLVSENQAPSKANKVAS